jgi:hypothetical protein
MGVTILVLALLAGDPARIVAGYWRSSAPAQPANAEQFPEPQVLLALPLPADKSATANYPILLDIDELETLYAQTRKPSLLYEIARKHQAAGNDDEAEAYYRAYLARAPYLDEYHDAAWTAAVEYATKRHAEAVERVRAQSASAVPEPMALMLAAMGWGF